jgi:hypothetical protein
VKEIWEKKFDSNDSYLINYGYSDINKMYFIGTTGNQLTGSETEAFGNIVFLEMSVDGNSALFRTFGDGASFQGNGFDLSNDQGIIITGSNKLNENSMITLMKLNNNYSL